VKHLLETTDSENNIPFEKGLRNVYKACLDMDEINKLGAQPATGFINKHFGGWAWQIKEQMPFQVWK